MVDEFNRRSSVWRSVDGARASVACAFVLVLGLVSSARAASPVPLGAAGSFAVLAGSTITNTGASTITGDIGLCCTGLATTGFGPGANRVSQPTGALYIGTGGVAAAAQDDLDIAYGNAAGRAVTRTVPVDLSLSGTPASPLLPGVYESTAHGGFQINTGLTLDFRGDPNAVFIFQGTDLATGVGTGGSVTIVNGGAAPSTCNVFWQLSDPTQAVTLGTGSAFKGTTMALGASVLGTGATVQGRILTRRSNAINLDTNTITRSPCSSAPGGGGGPGIPPTRTPPSTPSPSGPPGPGSRPERGTARLTGPSRPVSGPFTVSVTGHAILRVTFYLDGKRLRTVHAKPGRKRFKLKINPAGQSHHVHHVTARVTFTTASRTPRTTRGLVYQRSPAARRAPRFTG